MHSTASKYAKFSTIPFPEMHRALPPEQGIIHGTLNRVDGRQKKSSPSGPSQGGLAALPSRAAKDTAVSGPRPGRPRPVPGNPRAAAPARSGRGRNGHHGGAVLQTHTPKKTEGPGDRLNATHAKREERKRRRRVCGKAKQHLPDLLLNIALQIVEELGDPYTAKPALPHVPSPMQISGTSLTQRRTGTIPHRYGQWVGGLAAMPQ